MKLIRFSRDFGISINQVDQTSARLLVNRREFRPKLFECIRRLMCSDRFKMIHHHRSPTSALRMQESPEHPIRPARTPKPNQNAEGRFEIVFQCIESIE